MEDLKTWCGDNYRLEFSPEKTICLVMRNRNGQYSTEETYTLAAPEKRLIAAVRQVSEDEFVYFTGTPVKEDAQHPAKFAMLDRYRVRLRNGEVRQLNRQSIRDQCTSLYSKWGEKAYRQLLERNGFEEAEPKFRKLDLIGLRDYDRGSYEVFDTPQYFVVKDRRLDKIYISYTGMPCLGFKQLTHQFLILLSDGENHLLKPLNLPIGGVSQFMSTGDIRGACRDNREQLRLPNLECQLDSFYTDIYAQNGEIYRMQGHQLVPYPDSTAEKVVLRQKSNGEIRPLALVAEGVFGHPRMLGLVDPITNAMVGKVLNLVSRNFEEVESTKEMCALVEGTLRLLA